MPLEKGCVQIYTGNGKGKTTASLGLALRAVGRGLNVCVFQFIKGGGPYGEHLIAEKLAPFFTIIHHPVLTRACCTSFPASIQQFNASK